jgi:hypothetical protein
VRPWLGRLFLYTQRLARGVKLHNTIAGRIFSTDSG